MTETVFLFLLGTVSGKVEDAVFGVPLSDVEVTILETGKGTKTDRFGRFVIKQVQPATLTLKIEADDYETEMERFRLLPDSEVFLEISLTPALTIYGEEIEIEEERAPPPHRETIISKEEIERQIIKTTSVDLFNDLAETLKCLPGVISAGDFDAGLYVRGGYPLETIYLIDRVFIAWPYHWGGRLSMFNTKLIDKVDFYAGAYPAEGGQALAGVVDIKYKEGNREELRGEAELSPTTAYIQAEGPVKGASYIFASRRTHYDMVMKWFGYTEGNVFPYFSDHFAKVVKSSPKRKLWVYGLYSTEGMDMKMKEEYEGHREDERFVYRYKKGILSANWKEIINSRLYTETTLSYLYDKGIFDFYSPIKPLTSRFTSDDVSLRSDISYQLKANHELRAGLYIYRLDTDLDLEYEWEKVEEEDGGLVKKRHKREIMFDDRAIYYGLYLWDKWRIYEPLIADIGIRYEYLDWTGESDINPRLSMRYLFGENSSVKVAYGAFSQFSMDISELDKTYGNPNLSSENAYHYIIGYDSRLTENTRIKIEGYYKKLYDLIVAEPKPLNYSNRGKGFAKGLELFLQKKESGRWDGWVAYAYSISKRSSEREKEDPKDLYYTEQDQRHTLSIVGNWKLTDRWKLSMKWRLATGAPYTPIVGVKSDEWPTKKGTETIYYPIEGKYNSKRKPGYQRLDLKLSYNWKFKGWDLSTYIQILNLYNHKNIYDYYYKKDFSNYENPKAFKMFGLMFLGGIELRW